MRITESRLRSIIRKIILESVEVGRRIKPGFNIDVASFAYVLRSIAKYASTGHDFDMYTSDEAEKSDIVSQSNLEGLEIKISELDKLHSILGGQMNLYNDDITSVIKISKSIFENLGFTPSDYEILFSHRYNEDEDPDYQKSFIVEENGYIVFYLRD